MLKVLHTADVHLGAKFVFLGEKAGEHRGRLRKTFEKVVQLAIDKQVNIFVVAGDLFDSTHPSRLHIDFVKEQLKRLFDNGIWVAILPGTHDRLEKGSVFDVEDFAQGSKYVHVFKDLKNFAWEIPNLDLTVYGKPNTLNKSRTSPLKDLNTGKTKLNAALAHGSVQIEGKSSEDDYPITEEEILNSGMNYIALGHWHSCLDVTPKNAGSAVKVAYCGSPEIVHTDQKGKGSVIIANVDEKGTKIEKVEVGELQISAERLDLGKFGAQDDLKKYLVKEASQDLIKLVVLEGVKKGTLQLNNEELMETLKGNFYFLKIIDESSLELGEGDLGAFPEELVVGRFVKLMKGEMEKAEDKNLYGEALQSGVRLLASSEAT